MKKWLCFILLFSVALAGCHSRKESPYNRNAGNEYELFLSKHIFAACQNINTVQRPNRLDHPRHPQDRARQFVRVLAARYSITTQLLEPQRTF